MAKPDDYGVNDPLHMIVDQLIKWEQDKQAEELIDTFAKAAGNHIELSNSIAKLYHDVRAYDKCEKQTLKVLDMCPDPQSKYSVRANLAKMYNAFNEPKKALFYSKQNLAVNPESPETKLEMVFSYFLNGQKKEAEIILREMKEVEYIYPEHTRDIINFNLGTYDMEAGDFLGGLGGFLLNVKKLDLWFNNRDIPLSYWDGTYDLEDNPLILYMSGGGYGDAFIAITYMKKLQDRGIKPIFVSPNYPEIIKMFKRHGYESYNTWEEAAEVYPNAHWCFAFESVLYAKMTPEEMKTENFLWASDEARKKWAWLKDRKKLKVGVRFIGNKRNNQLLYRHIELPDMMAFLHETFKGQDVEYYSLQKKDGEEEAAACPELINIADQIESFEDTAALLENLDIVISTCTSIVHLSAAVGTKTVVFVPIAAYFTYLMPQREDRPEHTSLWYGDNFRYFRQTKPKDWSDPMREAKKFIQKEYL
jgi:hypothetical protein